MGCPESSIGPLIPDAHRCQRPCKMLQNKAVLDAPNFFPQNRQKSLLMAFHMVRRDLLGERQGRERDRC